MNQSEPILESAKRLPTYEPHMQGLCDFTFYYVADSGETDEAQMLARSGVGALSEALATAEDAFNRLEEILPNCSTARVFSQTWYGR